MKTFIFSSLLVATFIIAACHSTKKTTTTASTAPAVKPSNGVFAPGDEQLTAVKTKYPDATLAALTEGHGLYVGTCTNCHGTKSIYRISEEKWPSIIDDMAHKAKLTNDQKDALSKFVFSIKASQPAGK